MFGRILSQFATCCLLSSPASTGIGQLERTLFWLGIVCAIALMLPLPICLYHFRRVGALLAEIDKLQSELREQEALKARLDSLLAGNDKLETDIKQLQESYRTRLLTAQEKHQETVDKLKGDLRALEAENKRLSGLILLKEQASKKL
jgi:hypothetical protein